MLKTLAVIFFMLACGLRASEISDWVGKLGSPSEEDRAAAIRAIRAKGAAAEAELKQLETTQKMEPQQLLIVRRLIGEIMIDKQILPPLDEKRLVPFGEDKEKKIPGDPNLLVDKDKKIIVMSGEFCLESGPLEYLVVSKGRNAKMHESVVDVKPQPRDICTALLVCAYTYAGELGDDGKVNLPPDAGIMISLEFDHEIPHAKMKPRNGDSEQDDVAVAGKVEVKRVRVPMECFVWNAQTERSMKREPFAFTGSRFEKDDNGRPMFMADIERSIVAVKLDPYAVMNTPLDMRDVDPQRNAGYAINRFTIPPRKTPCRVVFEPWTGKELKAEDLKDSGDKNMPGTPASQP